MLYFVYMYMRVCVDIYIYMQDQVVIAFELLVGFVYDTDVH